MKNLKIKSKLVGGFIITAVIVLIVGVTAVLQLGKMENIQNELAREKLPAVQNMLEMQGYFEAIAGSMRVLLTPYAPTELRKKVHQDLLDIRKEYAAVKEEFLKLEFADHVQGLWDQFSNHLGRWVAINNEAVLLSEQLVASDIANPTRLNDHMNSFEIAHQALLAKVGKLLVFNEKFQGGTDYKGCSLGKWLENPDTTNPEILALARELRIVHQQLHTTVAEIKTAAAEGQDSRAREMAQEVLFPTSEQVFAIVHTMKKRSDSSYETFRKLNKLLLQDATVHQVNTFKVMDEIIDKAEADAKQIALDGEVVASKGRIITIAGIFIGISLALLLGFYLTFIITRPLSQGVKLSETMANGDMTSSMEVKSQDEIGVLANSLNRMAESLRSVIADILGDVKNLEESSSQLAVISDQMSTGAEDTADRSKQVAAAAEEMSANQNTVAAAMEQAATNVNMVAAATEEMSATISEIAQNSSKAKDITFKAVSQSAEASNRVDELGKAAHEINKVTETITEISEQTNLLALNATIEAARAGEAGKGFAVVANEIKDLAKQTSEATQDIQTKIESIQNATGITVKEINDIKGIINEVDTIVATIAAAVEEQSATTNEIAENVNQASEGINEVNENVAQSSTVSADIAGDIAEVNESANAMTTSSSQVKENALELSAISARLKEMMARFEV